MTEQHRTDPHLTDDELSALLDHALEGAAPRRHLQGCASCRGRLARLDGARLLVRTPVAPVPASLRSSSIRAVLDAVAGPPAPAPATPPEAARDVRGPAVIRVLRRPRVLVGAAAALLLGAAVATPLALSGSGTTSSGSTASRRLPDAGRRAPAGPATTGKPGAPSDALAPAPLAQASGTGSAGALGGLGVTDFGVASSVGQLRPALAVPASAATTSPGSASAPQEAAPHGAATPVTVFDACLPAASAAAPGRAVRQLGTATVGGSPALVYVFGPPVTGSPTGRAAPGLAVVTGRGGCTVLGTTTL